jgi:hypothetical protein
MRIIVTEHQLRLLENKTKYDFGFDLFKDMVYVKYPFIKKIVFEHFYTENSKRGFFIVKLIVYLNFDEVENFVTVEDGVEDEPFEGRSDFKDELETRLGYIYDRLPKNVRYNYPDDHDTWPGEAAGINVVELINV